MKYVDNQKKIYLRQQTNMNKQCTSQIGILPLCDWLLDHAKQIQFDAYHNNIQ